MAYQAWSVVFGEQPSASKWNILGTNDASFNDGSGFANGALGSVNASLANGIICQVVKAGYSAGATGTTTIPYDDTIPQNTEGTEFMSLAITPKSTTNILIIMANVYGSGSVASEQIAALFQDSTANALSAVAAYMATPTGRVNLHLMYTMVAGTTSSTTFKVRAGLDTAGTYTFNGFSGGRKFGAIDKSSMLIMEYKAT